MGVWKDVPVVLIQGYYVMKYLITSRFPFWEWRVHRPGDAPAETGRAITRAGARRAALRRSRVGEALDHESPAAPFTRPPSFAGMITTGQRLFETGALATKEETDELRALTDMLLTSGDGGTPDFRVGENSRRL